MNTSLYYEEPKFNIGNPNYFLFMCEGQRGRGKTSRWLCKFVKHVLDTICQGNHKKFIYLRRTDKEMELALEAGLFNGCVNIPEYKWIWEDYPKQECKNGNIYLIDKKGKKLHVGYYFTLNNVKGISIEDADCLLFDEYVAVKRSAYKGGEYGIHEPDLFFRLLETIFRRRDFWCVLLGNRDTPSNPYNEVLKIPLNCGFHKDKSKGVWYEYDYSEATAEQKSKTALGIITKGTTYSDYSMGLKSMNEIDECLIADKPSHAVQIFNVKMLGKVITIWRDVKNAILYLTTQYKLNSSCATVCVTNSDMCVNADFIKYNSQFLEVMRSYYGGGQMRFNNQETASLFATMLSLK